MRSLILAAVLAALTGCAGAATADHGENSPYDRAIPESASGHPTDSPTSSRTGAQRPPETPDDDDGQDED